MPAADLAAALDHVSLRLGERMILNDITLQIPAGKLTAILGPNGCGKSTIARMLSGFVYPTQGAVHILEGTLGNLNVHALRERVKLVQPTMPLEPDERMTVYEIVLTGAFGTIDLHDEPDAAARDWARQLVHTLGLNRVANNLFRTCSSGERMRTQIARALMARPELLILDEPTAGLDLPMREQLLVTLERLLATPDTPAVLVVTHHLEELPPSTAHAIVMMTGRVIASGSPREVLTTDVLSRAFDFPIAVTRTEDGRFFGQAKSASLFEF